MREIMTMLSATRAGPLTVVDDLRSWPVRRWLVAAAVALAVALVTGVPTDIVPTSLYRRMTPVVWWNFPIWALTAALAGMVAATYVRAGSVRPPAPRREGRALLGGISSFLAVGCPICNKLVVALLGAGGALSYFGPAQPVIGVAGLALLATSLAVRMRARARCSLPAPS